VATVTDSGYPTLLDVIKRLRPDGSVEQQMADTLSKELPLLKDMPMREGNLPTGHQITSKTALPSPTWRRFNQGVDPKKGKTLQYVETCGLLEDFSKIDVQEADLNGNAAAYRASEDNMFLEAYGQEVGRALWYESVATNPERLHGLTVRYPATTGYTASKYVLKPGTNSGSNCDSVWLITWDEDRIFGIYPKASIGGLQSEDMGKQLVPDSNNKQFLAYVTHYAWKIGLAVKDYRYAVRMQWDPDDSTNFADTAKGMFTAMENMLATVWKVNQNSRFYMSRTARAKLGAQLANNDARFGQTNLNGVELVDTFMNIPIRIDDSLTLEAAIS
jgi:hypothetical protein